MSSHARPCYQVLAQYTQNGINPIIAPTPAETEPQLYGFHTPHTFSQKDYEMHSQYSKQYRQPTSKCTYYSKADSVCPNGPVSPNQVAMEYQPQAGFNDVSVSRWY